MEKTPATLLYFIAIHRWNSRISRNSGDSAAAVFIQKMMFLLPQSEWVDLALTQAIDWYREMEPDEVYAAILDE